jgi:hypothetical protein
MNNKYEFLLSFGDSTVAGCELLDDCTDSELTKPLSFSNQLANKLNIPCINYGWTGGSNDRSLRLLPEALLTYPNSLVLFHYTHADRTEFFTLNADFPQIQNESYAGFGKCWQSTSKKHRQLNEIYLTEFYENPDKYNRYKFYNTMLTVEALCQKYAKDFLHIFLCDELFLPPDYQQVLYDAIDKDKIYKFDSAQIDSDWRKNNHGYGSLYHWAKMNGDPYLPGRQHINQLSHDKFATELYNKFK